MANNKVHQDGRPTPSSTQKSTEDKATTAEVDTDSSFRYGWFGFTPDWLQWANTAAVYCFLMTMVNIFASGTTNGLAGVVQSSIERRFEFSSQQMSWVVAAYEVFSVPILVFIAWLGTVGCHRPRWVAGCMLSSVAGCLVYALPHLISEQYQPAGAEGETYLCANRTSLDDPCEEDAGSSYGFYLFLFILARVLLSLGGNGLYTLGVTFLDDCLTKPKFSLYSSLFALGGILGPALGFIAGGLFLNIYTEWPSIDGDDVGLAPGHPLWVGAWWLPLMVFSVALFFLFFPMSGYPSDLPGAAEVRANKGTEAFGVERDEVPADTRRIDFTAADIVPYTKSLFTNWTFIFLTLYVCCDMSILSGFTVFGPKYAEVQFSLTPAQAGVVFGLLVVPAGTIGTIAGGLVIDKWELSIKQIMKVELIVSIMVIFMGSCFLVQCGQVDFAGVNIGYPTNGSSPALNITSACNADCQCGSLPYSPVCSHDNTQFFSPCHAGCTDRIEDPDAGWQFYNCSCILDLPSGDPEASWSICNNPECGGVPIFGVLLFFAMVGLFMSEAMNISAVIRCIPNKQRVYGMFLNQVMVRFVGTMPGPLLLAAIFDSACLLWQEGCDGEQGGCYYYDNAQLGNRVMIYSVLTKLGSIVSIFFAYWLYRPPKNPVMVVEVKSEGAEEVKGGDMVLEVGKDETNDKDWGSKGQMNGFGNEGFGVDDGGSADEITKM